MKVKVTHCCLNITNLFSHAVERILVMISSLVKTIRYNFFILWTFLGIICLWNCYKSFPLWLNISNFFILYTILHQIFCMYVYVFVQDWYVARNCWGPRMSNLMYATILPFRFIVPISRSWAAMFDSLLLPWPPSLACLQLMLSNC